MPRPSPDVSRLCEKTSDAVSYSGRVRLSSPRFHRQQALIRPEIYPEAAIASSIMCKFNFMPAKELAKDSPFDGLIVIEAAHRS
jgi:hypothetical protein